MGLLSHSFEFLLGNLAERCYVIFIGEDVHIEVQGEPVFVLRDIFVRNGIVSDIASVSIVILGGNIVIVGVIVGC